MLREFKDKNGTAWRVWDVDPQTQPRMKNRRKSPPTGVQGWLCFECGLERRRLSPIPKGWDAGDPDALADLCDKAQVVPAVSRNFEPRKPNPERRD